MKRFVLFLLLAFLAAPGPAVSADPEILRFEESMDAMGSTYSIIAYGYDRQRTLGAIELAFEEVKRLDELLSNYRPNSEWSQINRFAGERPVKVSKELFDLISDCVNYSRASDGAFDITVGPLMRVWGFYKGTGHLPHRAEVRGALEHVGYQNIVLNSTDHSIRFKVPGMDIDPGGIGKGYAVDKMVAVLRTNGVDSALVSGGGSSIYGIGVPAGEARGWHVSIRDPKHQERTVQEIYLKNNSISTSGSYEKFFYAEGRTWSHIMDPRTGFPAEGVLSASVIAPRTIDSEAWAKPFFIDGPKKGHQWLQQLRPKGFRVYLCEDKSEQACGWLQ